MYKKAIIKREENNETESIFSVKLYTKKKYQLTFLTKDLSFKRCIDKEIVWETTLGKYSNVNVKLPSLTPVS